MLKRLVLVGLLVSGSATAQGGGCAPHQMVADRLADHYGESRQVIAMGGDGSLLEVFAELQTGTWTIVVTKPGGLSCVVAAGDHYQHVGEVLPDPDA